MNRADKGREQIEGVIRNFPNMVPDSIDLSAFMDDEKIHRIRDAWCYRDKLVEMLSGHGETGNAMPWTGFHGNMEFRPAEMTLWAGFKGHGKALSIDTDIPTVHGWQKMSEIVVGESVFDENGNVCKVTHKTEVMIDRPCYELTFSDGTKIIADEQHEWLTNNYKSRMSETHNRANDKKRKGFNCQQHKRHMPSLVTTGEIYKTLRVFEGKKAESLNHAIDSIKYPVEYKQIGLPIHPYVLGAWLGDGSSRGGYITCAYSDIELIEHIRNSGYEVNENKSSNENSGLFKITNMTGMLTSLGLKNNKHIPREYMESAPNQRMDLLRGLLDTDGHIDKNGRVEFCNTNEGLALAVKELASSFGIVPTMIVGNATLYGKNCGLKYRVFFTTNLPVFKLSRKLKMIKKSVSVRNTRRFIVECKKIKSVPVKCIQVDSPSHLYLATKSFIPTHNSVIVSQVLEHLMDKFSQKVFIISPEFPAHRVLYRLLVQSIEQRYPDIDLLDNWLKAVREQLWIYDQQKSLTPNDVPALCRYAIKTHGVQHILIDSLMKCGVSPEDYGEQKKLVDTIQQVAHNSNAHVHLVAHLRKGKSDDEIGGLHDVKGASEIADLCENVIICWRNKRQEINQGTNEPDAVIKVEAQRNADGWIGKKSFSFNKHNMKFTEWAC